MEASNNTRISVVIPTRNRPQDLQRCLRSVLQLDYPEFEVIVVDQSLSDEGERLAAELQDKRVHYIRSNSVGRARGANIGIANATGQILAFTDDDITVPTNWLSRISEVFAANPGLGVYFGAVSAPVHDVENVYIPTFMPKAFRVIRGGFSQGELNGMGANMAISRPALEKVKGFDSLMGVGSTLRSGEDFEIAYRALRAGFTAVEDPEVALIHYGARPVANGQADKLIMSYLFGHGAGYFLNASQGDLTAFCILARELTTRTWHVLSNLATGHRPIGVRRLAYVLYGAYRAAFYRRRGPGDSHRFVGATQAAS